MVSYCLRIQGLTCIVADLCVVDSTYLAGHAAAIYLSLGGKPQRIGTFGILHPKVLQKFELPFPTSTLELNVEVFL
jgi:phenylalanyl-tRNA synthetase beta chain